MLESLVAMVKGKWFRFTIKTPSAKGTVSTCASTTTTDAPSLPPEFDPTLFTFDRWLAGSIKDLGVPCREKWILSGYGRGILTKAIIGWCHGERLVCRPKVDHVAVMIEKGYERFWFHLRRNEFEELYSKGG